MSETQTLDSAALERLVGRVADEFTERLNRGEQPDIEEYSRRHPEAADLLRQVLPALRLIRNSAASLPSDATTEGGSPPSGYLGDFRILREVGRGGMGVVYEAEQISLGRRVALKVLPLAAMMDPRHLQRFKNEAQAAAHLQHQNIVPVYFVGCDRGVHYYAMQFIDGHSLADIIDQLRLEREGRGQDPQATTAYVPAPAAQSQNGTPAGAQVTQAEQAGQAATVSATPGSGLSRTTYCAWVARLGEQAALALEHAHQLGVLHRDIKPANLLLDNRGNLWVTDFGLAHLPGDQRLTMTGDLLGTLRYMSPEQALAQRVIIDQRTDVYSLGVTLYELLTLRPAYSGRDRQELLRQIAFEEPDKPRRLEKSIPLELETIVLKAMAKTPNERYATAQELADDLARWLKDEPIRARRPTLWQRARKWGRRNASWVWAGAISGVGLLLLTVVALTLGMIAVNNERKRTSEERDHTREERDRTKEALAQETRRRQQLRRSLELMSSAVTDRVLTQQKVLLPGDEQFLRDALALYEEFARDTAQDEASRAGVARAYYWLAQIQSRLGQQKQALATYRESQRLLARLAADFVGVPAYRKDLARCHSNVALLLHNLGQSKEAEDEQRKALALQNTLAEQFPTDPAYGIYLATSHHNLGLVLSATGHLVDAENEYRAALAIRRRFSVRFPKSWGYRNELAMTHNNLAELLRQRRQFQEAEEEYRAALRLRQELVHEMPTDRDFMQGLATNHHNLGMLLAITGRAQPAEQEFRDALICWKQLAADFPNVPVYREQLAGGHASLGVLLKNAGRAKEAEKECRAALDLDRRLVDDLPNVPGYRHRLAADHANLSVLLAINGRPAPEVEHECRTALTAREGLAAQFPTNPQYVFDVAESRNNLGCLLQDTGQFDAAEKSLRAAVETYRGLAAKFPGNAQYAVSLSGGYCNLAFLCNRRGNAEAAFSWCANAGQLLESELKREPRLAQARSFLGNTREQQARALAQLRRYDQALQACEQALLLGNQGRRRRRILHASLLARAAKHARAVSEADALTADQGLSGADDYNLACVYAISAKAATDDVRLCRRYADRAIELLRRAMQAGWHDTASMQHDGDLDSLRGRADFQKLTAVLQAGARKPAKK